ncbi:MAG: proteasome accessory factor, partial [Micromonosporaceae bacterium]|nr:proteasome accessory factor [Micromonosporaceae bacterium]
PREATVVVRQGRAAGIRRHAAQIVPGARGDRMVLRYADPESLATWLVGYGSDVLVVDPPEVRDFVLKRLHEIAGAHPGPVPAGAPV